MRVKQPFTCRRSRTAKRWAVLTMIAMTLSPIGRPVFQPTVHAQQQVPPVSQGFNIDAGALRFIYEQILVAQDHAAGGALLGSGPNQVSDPQLPRGLRTVDGSFNNLVPVPEQRRFVSPDLKFPRLTVPSFRAAEQGTSYAQTSGDVVDSQPRMASTLILDQTATNPAAVAANANPCGSGGFVCSNSTPPDPVSGALFIPNITPDFGLSAPFNLMFVFFGQFFDHGLDLVTKGGNGTVLMPLAADDPLVAGTDGIFGTADDMPPELRFIGEAEI